MTSPEEARGRKSRRLFVIVLGLLLFEYLFLIADRRLPLGHETLTRFGLQYTFVNGAAQDGTIPLWLPCAAQGTPSNWAWFEQGTFLQDALLAAAPLFRGARFLPLFHLGMLLEELLLLLGVWLLASKHFPSPAAVFFVAVSAVGSSLWMDHAAQNLLTVSALPLVLAVLHEVVETGSRRKGVLLGVLLVVQALGKPPAFALLIPGAALVYGVGLRLFSGRPLRIGAGGNRREWLLLAGPPALLLLLIALSAFPGASDLVHVQRDGRFTGKALLAGAGLDQPLQYLDFGLCISPNLDATCFAGFLTLAFALLAIFGLGLRPSLRLLAFFAVGLLFVSALTLILGVVLPIPFPARPPTPGVPLVRLIVVFLAGFGFQQMLDGRFKGTRSPGLAAALMILLGVLQGVLFEACLSHPTWTDLSCRILTLGSPPEVVSTTMKGMGPFSEQKGIAALMAGLAGVILLLWSSRARRVPLALGLVLFVHPLDVFGWRFRTDWLKSRRSSPSADDVQKLSGLAFIPRRASDRQAVERFRAFNARGPATGSQETWPEFGYGVDSWLNDSFWFADLPASPAPAQYWSSPVDQLRRALPPASPSTEDRLPAPWNSEIARRLAGVSRDKLRFFSRAHAASSTPMTAAIGDLLFVEGSSEEPLPAPDRDEHLDLKYEILGFGANSLKVAVDAAPAGAWMTFADAWNPSWEAEVNGRSVPILRADLAYKAVRLEQGRNLVEFRFRSPVRTASSLALAILSIAGVGGLLREIGLRVRGRKT
jgi:hypothetical protein